MAIHTQQPQSARECMSMLQTSTKRYNDAILALNLEHKQNVRSILDGWALANARFKEGDTIATPDRKKIIVVKSVTGATNRNGAEPFPYVRYEGDRLDENLNPQWEGSPLALCDDKLDLVKIK